MLRSHRGALGGMQEGNPLDAAPQYEMHLLFEGVAVGVRAVELVPAAGLAAGHFCLGIRLFKD
jgi:hypothetical protein